MNKRSMFTWLLCVLWAFTVWGQQSDGFYKDLAQAALNRTTANVQYDPAYFSINYPNGDVPANKGVCTDVVIRSYRALEIDLQVLVHEDMKANFASYPRLWGLSLPDANIDHRRVPNLMTYFKRQGASLPRTSKPQDYQPGDLVAWDLGNGLKHIGVVSTQKTNQGRPLIVHNIGSGPQIEDILFDYTIIGHYRFGGTN